MSSNFLFLFFFWAGLLFFWDTTYIGQKLQGIRKSSNLNSVLTVVRWLCRFLFPCSTLACLTGVKSSAPQVLYILVSYLLFGKEVEFLYE